MKIHGIIYSAMDDSYCVELRHFFESNTKRYAIFGNNTIKEFVWRDSALYVGTGLNEILHHMKRNNISHFYN